LKGWNAHITWWQEGLGPSSKGDLFIEQKNEAGVSVEELVNNRVFSRYILVLKVLR